MYWSPAKFATWNRDGNTSYLIRYSYYELLMEVVPYYGTSDVRSSSSSSTSQSRSHDISRQLLFKRMVVRNL